MDRRNALHKRHQSVAARLATPKATDRRPQAPRPSPAAFAMFDAALPEVHVAHRTRRNVGRDLLRGATKQRLECDRREPAVCWYPGEPEPGELAWRADRPAARDVRCLEAGQYPDIRVGGDKHRFPFQPVGFQPAERLPPKPKLSSKEKAALALQRKHERVEARYRAQRGEVNDE